MWQRRIFTPVVEDLKKKMCWIYGPRQCGKTTLAERVLREFSGRAYNWDNDEDQHLLRKSQLDPDVELWALDEIHKYRRWRNWLKGLYDKHKDKKKFLVTGSARLDVFSRGGDSLQGRYFSYRLHPLTLTEMMAISPSSFEFLSVASAQSSLLDMFQYGGFPEPLLSGNEREAKRWRLGYGRRLFRDDVRDLELVHDLEGIHVLYDHLPVTVASVLSINSLREDLGKNFATVKNWLSILENLYAVFRIAPFGSPRIKAVKKEQKLYMWDWARVEDRAARFENLIALHLLRYCHWLEDYEGRKSELRFVRDDRGRETDFIVISEGKPLFLVECKLSKTECDKNLKYFLERLPIKEAFQVHLEGNSDYEQKLDNKKTIRIIPAAKFLTAIP